MRTPRVCTRVAGHERLAPIDVGHLRRSRAPAAVLPFLELPAGTRRRVAATLSTGRATTAESGPLAAGTWRKTHEMALNSPQRVPSQHCPAPVIELSAMTVHTAKHARISDTYRRVVIG